MFENIHYYPKIKFYSSNIHVRRAAFRRRNLAIVDFLQCFGIFFRVSRQPPLAADEHWQQRDGSRREEILIHKKCSHLWWHGDEIFSLSERLGFVISALRFGLRDLQESRSPPAKKTEHLGGSSQAWRV